MSTLFAPIELGTLTLPNRIVIAPMCQYSAQDGNATSWHLMHLGQLALSGAGMLIIEATAVEAETKAYPNAMQMTGPFKEIENLLDTLIQTEHTSNYLPYQLKRKRRKRKRKNLNNNQ